MDVSKLLKNVKNLDSFISVTQKGLEKYKNSKVQFNMSTVLALKKVQSYEVEYFVKYKENGIACLIIERMLTLPASKTWGVLGKELVTLMKYWLEALRKHLVIYNDSWWTFMKILLKFLRGIINKDVSLPNTLVELITECLLDLATNDRPDAIQRYEILHCLNMICAESSREIRFALRSKFGVYFTKLSAYMASCGHLPCQYSIMETLLRWLVPRQDKSLRATCAAKWFPLQLYSNTVGAIFLERPWTNFFQDARDLLNTHNAAADLITSVVCKGLTVGQSVIISGVEREDSWLDINAPTKCVSVLLDPRVLHAVGAPTYKAFETLLITYANTDSATLYKDELTLKISVKIYHPLQLVTSTISEESRDLNIAVTSHCNIKRLDSALRNVFNEKYRILLDLEADLSLSSQVKETSDRTEDVQYNIRLSYPAEVSRRPQRRSGFISGAKFKQRQLSDWKSPSSCSTSSLARLHEKLSALPRYTYDKKPASVCAPPDLSSVTELSETVYNQSNAQRYSVKNHTIFESAVQKSQSDNESRNIRRHRGLSPTVTDKNNISCLPAATIDATNDSVINETIENLSKSKNYNDSNVVDLLVQEALQWDAAYTNNIDKQSLNFIENSHVNNNKEKACVKKTKVLNCKVIDSTTTDESNTEFVNETPIDYVTLRKSRNKLNKEEISFEKQSLDVQIIEEFLSKHFVETRDTNIVISPKLIKKIQQTETELSDVNILIDAVTKQNENTFDFNHVDVIQCLNNMIDKVCNKFDHCTEYLNTKNDLDSDAIQTDLQDSVFKTQNTNMNKEMWKKGQKGKKLKLKRKEPKKNIDLKTRSKQRQFQLDKECSKMSTIIKDNTDIGNIENDNEIEKSLDRNNGETAKVQKNKSIIDVTNKNNKRIKNISKQRQEKPNANNPMTSTIGQNAIEQACVQNNEIIANTDVAKRNEVLDENRSTINLTNKVAASNTHIVRRKRKLYSPEAEHFDKSDHNTESEDDIDDIALSNFKIKRTPKTKATCYKEIEKDRHKRIRMPRNKNKNTKIDPPSPHTKKLNDIFDKLKKSPEGEKVTLVDKNSNSVFNFTSDSDDGDFKKEISVIKNNRTNTIETSDSTIYTRRSRSCNRVNYKESAPSNNKRKVTKRIKAKTKDTLKPVFDLQDERMREAKEDVFNTSMQVIEKIKDITCDPEPILKEPPAMEIIDVSRIEEHNSEQHKKKKIKVESLTSKKFRNITRNNKLNIRDDSTLSPLPELLVEPVPDNNYDKDLSTDIVNKLNIIRQKVSDDCRNEFNIAQNHLNDIDKNNYTHSVDVTEENNELIIPEIASNRKKLKNSTKSDSNKSKEIVHSRSSINISEKTGVILEKSIDTKCSITVHGDFEAPLTTLEDNIPPRDLEIDDLNVSLKDYFYELKKQIQESDSNVQVLDKEPSIKTNSSEKQARVSLTRLSSDDISRWLPSRRNSDTDSSSSKHVSSNKKEFNVDSELQGNKRKVSKTVKSFCSNASSEEKTPIIKLHSNERDLESLKESKKSKYDSKHRFESKSVEHVPSKKKSNSKKNKSKITYTSVISPIKLFSDDYDCLSVSSSNNKSEHEKCRTQTSGKKPQNIQKLLSIDSKASASTKTVEKIDDSREVLKRKTPSADRVNVKKIKIDVNTAVAGTSTSSQTLPSIEDWFKGNELTGNKERSRLSAQDCLRNIMERLDTTLVEIHQNTNTRFINMLVNAQHHLSELKQTRGDMYKQAAKEMLTDIVKTINNKFADLDKKFEEMSDDFMKQLKALGSELIQKDNTQKQTMFRLLRSDVQAYLDKFADSSE